MNGNFFANVFIHFEPIDPHPDFPVPEADIPPYIIPGSVWEKEWTKANPRGWKKVCLHIVQFKLIFLFEVLRQC